MTADFQSHILVSVPNVTLLTVATVENGDLSLECITFENNHTPQPNSKSKEVSGNTNNTVYLILHLNNHVYPIDPAIPLHLKHLPSGERTYSFRPTEGTGIPEVHLTIPSPPSDTHLKDAHEILDHVLSQYASLHHDSSGLPPIPTYDQAISTNFAGMHLDNPGLKGHLVLLDEASGEVVGELPRTLNIKEDETVRAGEKAAKAHDGVAAPVVLELPPNVYDEYMSGKSISSGEGEELAEVREVFVTVIPPEERDWMTRGAGLFR